MQCNLPILLSRVFLGIVLLLGMASVPSLRISELHSDSSSGSSSGGSLYELAEHGGYLNRRQDPSRRVALRISMGGFQEASLKLCPRDARLRRTLLTVSGHELSGHRLANRLLAPLTT